jgi:DNA-binding CsgD family transcriptional regulator
VAAARELTERNHIRLASVWSAFALGDLAAGLGDVAGAVGPYLSLESELDATGFADPDQFCAPELAEVLVHLGRGEEARRVADRFASRAAAKDHPWSLARAERALGVCSVGPDAEGHFRAALDHSTQTPDRYERARTELAFGAWLRRERRRVEARPLLAAALRAFDELGAGPWADRAARELHATGATAQRRTSPAEALTPQERQIAQLLASGRTTREAAAALFLSPKTVEYHLRHVYLKLGIRSRAELALALAPGSADPGQ